MANPRLLLCDEISLGLAPIVIRDIYAAHSARSSPTGIRSIIVEQDITQALTVAAHVYLPAGGPRVAGRRGRAT